MIFWIAGFGIAACVAALLGLALWRGGARAAAEASSDLQVYRDQLKEVARDRARGVLDADEADRLRNEVARRVLEADRKSAAGDGDAQAPFAANILAMIAVVAVIGGSALLYLRLGDPGAGDDPIAARLAEAQALRAERISQDQAEKQVPPFTPPAGIDPKFVDLVEKLRKAVAQRPQDMTGNQLLARSEARLGNYRAAWRAQAQINKLLGDRAQASDYVAQAGLMIFATEGYVSPEAEAVLDHALKLDPKNGSALYYIGRMYAQTGRPDIAFSIWAPLLARSKSDDPWVPPIRAQIEQAARLAGVNYQLPPEPGLPGPGAADLAASAQLSPAERKVMIRGMVAQLADRLDRSGGTAAEWARLIRSYGVLGEDKKQTEALARAEAAFAGHPQALAVIQQAAQGSGTPAAPAAATKGPTEQQMRAAADLSPAERSQMVETMVAQLAQRIENEGGNPAQWAQLMRAYGVLGETGKARALWQRAQETFAHDDKALALVRAAAAEAGILG